MNQFNCDLMKKVYRADLLTKNAKQAQQKRTLKALYVSLFIGVVFLFIISGFQFLFGDLPKIKSQQELWVSNRPVSLEIVDDSGNTLAYRGPRFGRKVSIDAIPKQVLQPFLAIEDARFFEHSGIDFVGVLRAVFENIVAGKTVQGASTITQQLVKNVYLSPEQTLKRKIQEMVLAWQIDSKYSKKEILEVYLNRIYFGQNSYGIDAAAWHYFSKKPQDLTLGEATMLAGLPKAPGKLSIDLTAKPAMDRRATVLQRMVEAGFIDQNTAHTTAIEPLVLNIAPEPQEGELSYAIDMVQKEIDNLPEKIAPDRIVRLTIDPKIQAMAVDAVNRGITISGVNSGISQGAMIAIDRTGRILALVGGRAYNESKFNRVTQAKRQPGSVFKPIVYAAGLESGLSPNSIFDDRPVNYDGWRPKNFGGNYSGRMTISSALTRSVNTIAVQVAAQVGITKVNQIAMRFGIESKLPNHLSVALGAGELTLLDITRAYATFANEGVRIEPFLVERIETTRGTIAYQRASHTPMQVFDPIKARQMTAMLSDVVAIGTGKRAQLAGGREAAGKTGTSQNFRDAWFVGYTADIICGVWVGNDEFKPMHNISGGTIPAIIWSNFMNKAHEGRPLSPLPTMDEIMRPDNKTMALFYENLAKFFEAAGGGEISNIGQDKKFIQSKLKKENEK